ncbi:thioredoxin [Pseudoxanthomonas gei]|uniref:Thioredoxin n=1 Tax=Pseudoxanthomonas gei TaxID=1383030 RepID=A0ABX0AB54_9GAMM|nr:thioredoxin family protein [Pseudoxanthomonas gei]NDK38803.1 thioredoxin [Pseudoxanthomonas gei]
MTYQSAYAAAEPERSSVDAMAGLTLIEFGAPWCGHCIAAQEALQVLLGSQPAITHIKVEDGRGRPLGRSFRVKLWPTLVLLQDGVEIARAVRPRERSDLAGMLEAIDSSH